MTPMPGAIQSPFGNGPDNIQSPVPTGVADPQGLASAPKLPQQGQAPPPAAAPASAPTPAQDNPFDTPMSGDQREKLKRMKGGTENPFDEKDPNFPTGYMPITPRLRRTPTNQIEVLRNSGKWEAMSDTEIGVLSNFIDTAQKWGLRAKEDLPRFVGSVLGGIMGARFGGEPGATVGSGAGQALGGAISNLVQGKDNTLGSVGADAFMGAAAAALPGMAAKGLAGQAAAQGASLAASDVGATVLAKEAAARFQASQAAGIPLRKDQVFGPGSPQAQVIDEMMAKGGTQAQLVFQAQAAQRQMLRESFDRTVADFQGPYKAELGGKDANWSQVIDNVMKNHERATGPIREKAFQLSNGAKYDVDPVLAVMRERISDGLKRNIFLDSGRIDVNLFEDAKKFYGGLPEDVKPLVGDYLRLQNAARVGMNDGGAPVSGPGVGSGQGTPSTGTNANPQPGLTLPEMDVFRKQFGDFANFQKRGDRTRAEMAYGEVYHSIREQQDKKIMDVLQPEDPQAASRFLGSKEFLSNNIENAKDLQKKIMHDPTNAATELVDGQSPESVRSLLSFLDDKQKRYLAGAYLDSISRPVVDPIKGEIKLTPVENAWKKIDPKVKDMLYGEDSKKIDAIINVAAAVNKRSVLPGYNPQIDFATKKLLGLTKLTSFKGGAEFVAGLLKGSPKAADYITTEAADVLAPTGNDPVSTGARQKFMQKAAQLSNIVTPYASKAVSADIGTHMLQPQKQEDQR